VSDWVATAEIVSQEFSLLVDRTDPVAKRALFRSADGVGQVGLELALFSPEPGKPAPRANAPRWASYGF
jgi:hypothetical protein